MQHELHPAKNAAFFFFHLLSFLPSASLKDDDLAGRMGLQSKELNKLMAVLSNDCLVQMCVERLAFFYGCAHACLGLLSDTVRTNSRKAHNDLWGGNTTMSTTSTFAT
jgi:hypothetical protein